MDKIKLSIIVPIFNEKNTLLEILDKVKSVKLKNIKKEIILIDDFSDDGTREILAQLKGYKILYHKKNQGKGAAIRTGLKNTTGDIILIQDADLEYDPDDYPKLLEPILHDKAKVVYGSRFRSSKGHLKEKRFFSYKLHSLGNRLLTLLTNSLFFVNLTDMESGYKVFTKDVIKNIKLRARRFDFEPEITAKILKKGYSIKEVPISYYSRDFTEGKKISWKDGIKAAFYLLKYRFVD